MISSISPFIFHDEKDEPILFIELVDTNKVSDEKKIKLRRIGINTVSIIVPRGSDQEIADNFKSIERVKWEFNEEEANTTYLSVSHRAPEGLLDIDEDQRRIFGESIACRRNGIVNDIRSITACLGGESYRSARQDFERELFRIKKATVAEQERLEELETRIDREVRNQFTEQNIDLERQGGKLDDAENKFQEDFTELEERYQSKKEEIRKNHERARRDKITVLQDGGTEKAIRERYRQRSEELRDEFEKISEDYKRIINEKNESIRELSERTETQSRRYIQLNRDEQDGFRNRKRCYKAI